MMKSEPDNGLRVAFDQPGTLCVSSVVRVSIYDKAGIVGEPKMTIIERICRKQQFINNTYMTYRYYHHDDYEYASPDQLIMSMANKNNMAKF